MELEYCLKKRVEAVIIARKTRCDAQQGAELDPDAYIVTADGEILTWSPATLVPPSQNYFLIKEILWLQTLALFRYSRQNQILMLTETS